MYLNKYSDFIYSYGGGITDIILKNIPNSKEKIIEIPAGIEPSWIYENNVKVNAPLRFAFLGRYEIRKGVKELSAALKNLVGKHNFEFHFIGEIPAAFKINSTQLIYHGKISDAEKIKSILQQTDTFVLPSHAEGMPNVILEAMANGCSILATDVGAVNVMVNESNGWLMSPLNEKEIENKIVEIIKTNPKEIEQKKAISVNQIKENFMWEEIIIREINAIYLKINE
jgi:glycosyltransferase involved in cell wall biosynthesis